MNPLATKCLLSLLFILAALDVHAEEGCPPGMIPASGTNVNSCVPIPAGYYQQNAPPTPWHSAPREQPGELWLDRYGAIAIDPSPLTPGSSYNESSRSAAEKAAIKSCQSNGGMKCKVEISYGNGCVAMVLGKTRLNTRSRPTIEAAKQAAMNQCRSNDNDCHVFYSACSLPVRIR